MRLHNLCLELNIPLEDPPVLQGEDMQDNLQVNDVEAVAYRNSIIRLFD